MSQVDVFIFKMVVVKQMNLLENIQFSISFSMTKFDKKNIRGSILVRADLHLILSIFNYLVLK